MGSAQAVYKKKKQQNKTKNLFDHKSLFDFPIESSIQFVNYFLMDSLWTGVDNVFIHGSHIVCVLGW